MAEPKSKGLSTPPPAETTAGTDTLKKTRRSLMDIDQIKTAIDSLEYPDIVALRDHLEKLVDKKHDEHVRQVRERIKNDVKQAGLSLQDVFGNAVSETTVATKGRKLPILYADPENPAHAWSGRGKTPGWLHKKIEAGARLEDFKVEEQS
jgi:DNA-binding protein H-NS